MAMRNCHIFEWLLTFLDGLLLLVVAWLRGCRIKSCAVLWDSYRHYFSYHTRWRQGGSAPTCRQSSNPSGIMISWARPRRSGCRGWAGDKWKIQIMEYDIKIDLLLLFGHIHCCRCCCWSHSYLSAEQLYARTGGGSFQETETMIMGVIVTKMFLQWSWSIQAVLTILDTESCK